MRHYEIVFMVHPDQSDQVPEMIERYQQLVTDSGGVVHRLEDWGRRQMAYPINKIHKAHYILLNVECNSDVLGEIESLFRFNDAVLRNLIIKRKSAVTEESTIQKAENENRERRARSEQRRKQEEEQALERESAKDVAEEAAEEAAKETEEQEAAADDSAESVEESAEVVAEEASAESGTDEAETEAESSEAEADTDAPAATDEDAE